MDVDRTQEGESGPLLAPLGQEMQSTDQEYGHSHQDCVVLGDLCQELSRLGYL